jgi:hypothetical protein
MKITENMITVDWLYDTGELAIVIQPKQYNLRDMEKTDFYTVSSKEAAARAEFEEVRKRIIKYFSNEIKSKT